MFDYIEKHYSRLYLLVFSIDFLVLLAAALIVFRANGTFWNVEHMKYAYLGFIYSAIFVFISQIMLFINELYSLEKKYQKKWLVFRCILSFSLVSVGLYLLLSNAMHYSNCFIISMIACGSILCWRFIFYWIVPKIDIQQRILFLGTDELSRMAVREILAADQPQFKVVGFVGDDPSMVGKRIANQKVLGLIEDLDTIIQKEKVEKLIISLPQDRKEFPAEDLIRCKFKGIEIMQLHTFYERLRGKILIDGLHPSWLIFAQGFRKSNWIRMQKRILDVALSLVGLLITLPISLITALLIKLESDGPVIYQQERVGDNGKIFKIFKFRSMRTDAEKESGPIWAGENDPRITQVGRFIRKVRIDEIPQMLNVLKGDMSFVGPRPERPHFVEMLTNSIPYYNQRHTVKPGITGWAAVNYSYGASVEDAVQKLQYDLYYIKNMSIFLDLVTILKTIATVCGRKGSR